MSQRKIATLNVECFMISFFPSQEAKNLKPKTQEPQTKNKKTNWVSLKEPQNKTTQFSCFVKVKYFFKNL